jgi:NTP pyrophosphatase (non-canonical NTP hydrolase)
MSQEVKDFFSTYTDFVTKVTSDPSINLDDLKKRFDEIEAQSSIKAPRLLTAALGLGSETGEFVEIVKKMVLQGKPASEDNIFHMKRELGDIMWYWTTACASLDLDPYEVISENQKKLEARYGERFEVQRSEVRKDGDL